MSNGKKKVWSWVLAGILALLISACSGSEPIASESIVDTPPVVETTEPAPVVETTEPEPTPEPEPEPTPLTFEQQFYLELVRGEAEGVDGLTVGDMTDDDLLKIADVACTSYHISVEWDGRAGAIERAADRLLGYKDVVSGEEVDYVGHAVGSGLCPWDR